MVWIEVWRRWRKLIETRDGTLKLQSPRMLKIRILIFSFCIICSNSFRRYKSVLALMWYRMSVNFLIIIYVMCCRVFIFLDSRLELYLCSCFFRCSIESTSMCMNSWSHKLGNNKWSFSPPLTMMYTPEISWLPLGLLREATADNRTVSEVGNLLVAILMRVMSSSVLSWN